MKPSISRFEPLDRIGTFDVVNENMTAAPFAVIDRDTFNNWGRRYFRTDAEARRYADWAHRFKTGRTFSEFKAA